MLLAIWRGLYDLQSVFLRLPKCCVPETVLCVFFARSPSKAFYELRQAYFSPPFRGHGCRFISDSETRQPHSILRRSSQSVEANGQYMVAGVVARKQEEYVP